jgi:ATP-binding cassette subfamily B protein
LIHQAAASQERLPPFFCTFATIIYTFNVATHSAIQCLAAVALHHGVQVLPERLLHDYALDAEEPETKLLLKIAEDVGLRARMQLMSWDALAELEAVFPLMARMEGGKTVVIAGLHRQEGQQFQVAVLDPQGNSSQILFLSKAEFCRSWQGEIVLVKRHFSLMDENQPFGLLWFIPEILKQRSAFRDITLAALILHFVGLAVPIFTQLVIDKVLVHESFSTLYVLTVGVVIFILFEAAFGYIRQYLMLAATNKIDIRLSRRSFAKLVSLSIDYFETNTAGVINRHMQQIHGIRGFLTGSLFFTALDSIALFIFLPILFWYSVKLTMVVLVISAMMAGVVIVMIKPFEKRLEALYSAEGLRQSMLVETIHGIRTVKSLALEPKQRKVWDQRSANAVTMHYKVGKMSLYATTLTGFLSKAMSVAIIALGAADIFDKQMTVGGLIAFQMLSGRIVGPLVQLVGLVQDYQQVAISVKMLGEIMNRPPERQSSAGLRPKLAGRIDIEKMSFRYPGSNAVALDHVSFSIKQGTVVGIVGRSGSGKTTLTKLLQGLYECQAGVIRFDGVDMREIDLPHLRRSMGVVLQENFMFRGTVRENIAMTRPDAAFEEIVAAAQTAGADEFIERMPQGYDSFLEENAANLSGGQRQRLAIARALLTQPRILILDEAASALDPDSEAIFMKNLSRISAGRTVIIVSHRLSTLVNSNQILVFNQGKIISAGTHGELLQRCETYSHLWHQQTSHL